DISPDDASRIERLFARPVQELSEISAESSSDAFKSEDAQEKCHSVAQLQFLRKNDLHELKAEF
ncbi:MAG: hypothetical protein AAFO98_01780, partial [Pseudomonadota bacterium]